MDEATNTVLLGAAVLCLVANLFIVVAKVAGAGFVLDNVREVGLNPRIVPLLALIQGAGVVGLGVGLVGYDAVGLAAAGGLILFFAVAVAAHLRSRVLHSIGFPLGFLALGAAAWGYFLTQV